MKNDGALNVCKAKGKVKNLEEKAASADVEGGLGIAHTRWTTHGEPNDVNAHPQVSQSGRIALVHNDTIENYSVLKRLWRSMDGSSGRKRIRRCWCS